MDCVSVVVRFTGRCMAGRDSVPLEINAKWVALQRKMPATKPAVLRLTPKAHVEGENWTPTTDPLTSTLPAQQCPHTHTQWTHR